MCPITSKRKGYQFEIALPDSGEITGVIQADHIKSVDWIERNAVAAGKIDAGVFEAVLARLAPLLGY